MSVNEYSTRTGISVNTSLLTKPSFSSSFSLSDNNRPLIGRSFWILLNLCGPSNRLKKAYYKNGGKEYWDKFEKIKTGATEENIKKTKEEFPETPDSLIELLKIVDGTYHREYQGEKIAFYFLGSDVMGYPYYLLSSSQILENKKDGYYLFGGYIDGEYEDVEVDEKITDDSEKIKWLHFSDCMNNGGTSKLFIDFSPSEKGKKVK